MAVTGTQSRSEETIAIERVAEHVGVEALAQEQRVEVRRPQDDAHRIVAEADEEVQQLLAVRREQPVGVREARGDGLDVGEDIHLGAGEGRAVGAAGDLEPLAIAPHLVGPGVGPVLRGARRELARAGAEAAQVDARRRVGGPAPRGQEPRAQHRGVRDLLGGVPAARHG